MTTEEIVLLALALSTDAFAVTVSDTFCYRGSSKPRLFMLPIAFGLFQGLMPLLGYLLGGFVSDIIQQYSGIVTLVILGCIGGTMIKEGVSDLRRRRRDPQLGEGCPPNAVAALTLKVILVQALATSIDAFAVGVSLRAAEVELMSSVAIIACTTFLCCLVALSIGRRFGNLLGERAQVVGGVVLVIIGLRSLLS